MFYLTHQERKVLIFIGVLILTGSILKFLNFGAVQEGSSFDTGKIISSQNISHNRVINVNEAFSEDLESITGIGEVIAGRIIDYRIQFGPFKNSDDLKKVRGIGDKKIKAIERCITFN